ncbi:unnamed protein product [Spirodela intermedia]|uniref:Phospholipase D n=1 Tax=Spirodela intermedia TaxID=51605 RepID=A0A7I8IRH4_SPIIN|nr:unnamed protein product [Spirodela intermedia]CAA6660147.1 unnamed protein product [Spirodela intermedia]
MESVERNVEKGTRHLEGVKFLHGDLDLWILEARSLPNMDLASERIRKCFSVFGSCSSPFKRPSKSSTKHSMITSDPYVSVSLGAATVAQTKVIQNSENPKWEEHFYVPVAHPVAAVEFHVKDNDILGAELIGTVSIPVDTIFGGKMVNGWFPVVGPYGNPLKPYPELHLSVVFKPVQDNPFYGAATAPEHLGVENAYFPLHREGRVTLYQDAHLFEQGKCWEDIFRAILNARHLVYVTGWSIYHPVKLLRENQGTVPKEGQFSLGELLKHKSQEGVRVLMLVWDDKTSHDKFILKTDGVMKTHDEKTRKFFKHSGVQCVLAPRYASNKLSIVKQKVVGTLFSHHQKCVLVDTPAAGDNRKITAFIGGLDLCDGRYDTPEHWLFSDLESVFENDFHNPTYPLLHNHGPRQAWHDLHCRIEGPAAYDVLTNFEQRWRKTTKWRGFKVRKVAHWHNDALIKIDQTPWILTPSKSAHDCPQWDLTDGGCMENWHVQIFRSIDSGSVKGFPKVVQEAEAKNLVCAKNVKIDRSIHTAYVKAIRSAQHFLYIENQYFVGSSYGWPSYKNAGADNLVPMEIALKIASKIRADERFAAYIVIPMWPEGIPSTVQCKKSCSGRLDGQTMKMMYKIIAGALEEMGSNSHPLDYLNFYCLGKREAGPEENTSTTNHPPETSSSCPSQKFRRFMIYVHAKGMIVDDEYVMIGSANINQRSLDGSRDTEIAMGAYQPNYRWSGTQCHPRGQVFGYRMSLWAEHLGTLEGVFEEPHALGCVRRVNELSDNNWQAYISEETEVMKGHLMRYPVLVGRDGKVDPLPGYECFPDVGGKVLGAHSNTLPDSLTT